MGQKGYAIIPSRVNTDYNMGGQDMIETERLILREYTLEDFDALYEIMGADTFLRNMEKGAVEVAPLAYMRGRTLDNSFIVLDEAQNTTPEQMKMFLTRLGYGSKAVITGDVTQIDLPKGKNSGLIEAVKILSDVDDIEVCKLTNKDVVRHPLVQNIIKAYEKYEKKQEYKNKQGK